MGDREFKFDADAICEACGKIGAFDIYGDNLCAGCIEPDEEPEGKEPR